ncbi:MAG: GIY-YIG nuclease family protein [Bdellovibrionota bacterium]
MSSEQLPLFTVENPLKTRFTSEFFKSIPTGPGVYWMLDERGEVLYVGKAKDLRARLRSYRNTSLERHSSKTRRLLKRVEQIHWDELNTEEEALLRENEFLRWLKPKFNVVGVRPETYLYFSLNVSAEAVEIARLFHKRDAKPGDRLFGAFKGIENTIVTFGSLVRWTWSASRGTCEWPIALLKKTGPARCRIPLGPDAAWVPAALFGFFSGANPLPELILPEESPTPFTSGIWMRDQLRLERFSKRTRHFRELTESFGRSEDVIDQLEIDDLLVQRRFRVAPDEASP